MHDPFSDSFVGYRDLFGSFGTRAEDLDVLLVRASKIAREKQQTLNTAHVLMAAFDPHADPLPPPLDTAVTDTVRLEWYFLASEHVDSGGLSPQLDQACEFARNLAGTRALSWALLIYAIAETDKQARSWLTSIYVASKSGTASDLQALLRSTAEKSLTTARVIAIDSGQLHTDVRQWLSEQRMQVQQPYTFAHAHSAVLRNIATEFDMRTVREIRIPLVRGPKGSGIERIAHAVAEAPKAGLPFSWPFTTAYHLNTARLLARNDARNFLEAVVKEAGPTSALVLTEAREFDRSREYERRAQECIDYLTAEAPTNLILVYPTDDAGNLADTKLRRASFQDFTVDPLMKAQTQIFVQTHFWKYWEVVEKVSVAADAFDDVYPVSAFIFEDDLHYNLPYLPVVLGSNAARTAKAGKDAVAALVEAAQSRLNAAQENARSNRSLNDVFARYFLTLQMELEELRTNPEPPARNGMLLVTRELVSAELAASAVYVFQWAEIQAMGRLSPIVPEMYPK